MDKQLTVIETTESDLDDARFYHGEVIVLLEAVDTLRGTGKYKETSELSVNDAAQIVLEAAEVEDSDLDINKVRADCVEREANLREGIMAIKARLERLKAEAYDRTEQWLNDKIKEEKHLPNKCRSRREVLDVLTGDAPKVESLQDLVDYVNKKNEELDQ